MNFDTSQLAASPWPGLFSRAWLSAVWPVVLIAGLLAGCQDGGEVSPAQKNLSWLGSMYGMYVSQNGGEAPKSIDDLRKFVAKKATPEQLAQFKVVSIDQLFTSPRDGKLFALVTYTKLPTPGVGPPPLVLYETDGKDGQRAVALLGGVTDIVDEAKFSQLLPAKR
jgi:hypothetical protein